MANIKNEGLFGETVPGVFIDSIVLESTSGLPAEVRNPHIDHAREEPTIITEPSRLKTTLNITMKESDNHIFSSLVGNEDLHEHLKIGIIQSTRSEVIPFDRVQEIIISNPTTGDWSTSMLPGINVSTISLSNPDFNIDPIVTGKRYNFRSC